MELKTGTFRLGNYTISCDMEKELLKDSDFECIITKTGETICISKQPFNFEGELFWCRITFRDSKLKDIELHTARPEFIMSYSTMTDSKIKMKREFYENFLIRLLGKPHEESLSGIEYTYNFGIIISYYDIKSCDMGIILSYQV